MSERISRRQLEALAAVEAERRGFHIKAAYGEFGRRTMASLEERALISFRPPYFKLTAAGRDLLDAVCSR